MGFLQPPRGILIAAPDFKDDLILGKIPEVIYPESRGHGCNYIVNILEIEFKIKILWSHRICLVSKFCFKLAAGRARHDDSRGAEPVGPVEGSL